MSLKDIFTNQKPLLSVFTTAGYPELNSTETNILGLEKAGVDFIELGIPFSDPMADGKTIQDASQVALNNGMNLELLLEQLTEIRQKTKIPVILMGYLNPIYIYGMEKLLQFCQAHQVDGLIIPDISLEEYKRSYQAMFEQYGVHFIFLVTTRTEENRLKEIDQLSQAFIYLVSSSAVTGKTSEFSQEQLDAFQRIKQMELNTPIMVGFGIHNPSTFHTVGDYFSGAIVGSAFIRYLAQHPTDFSPFVKGIKG